MLSPLLGTRLFFCLAVVCGAYLNSAFLPCGWFPGVQPRQRQQSGSQHYFADTEIPNEWIESMTECGRGGGGGGRKESDLNLIAETTYRWCSTSCCLLPSPPPHASGTFQWNGIPQLHIYNIGNSRSLKNSKEVEVAENKQRELLPSKFSPSGHFVT